MNFEAKPFVGLSTSISEMRSHRRATMASCFTSAVYTVWRT